MIAPLLACIALLHGTDPWEPLVGSMDSISTFSFSQSDIGGTADAQIATVAADLNIRTFSSWHNGTSVSEYNPKHLSVPRLAGVVPTGGLTATVAFRSEAPSDSAFLDWISRDAHGDTLAHDEIASGAYRGNLACPGFREHVLQIARTQIDFGTDGIFFDEVDGSFGGGKKWSYNGNEGYDDYHLKEFNQWLVDRFPGYSKADFISKFGMDSSNALDPSKALDDLTANFNYRTYLRSKNWANNPHTSSNPLSSLYGKPTGNRMTLHPDDFLDSSNTSHWREIVSATRQYARGLGREVLVTSNGIEPFVDFNSFGLYDWNSDGLDGGSVSYVPTNGSDLDGTRSLLAVFQSLRKRSATASGDVPLTAFIDWPTTVMDNYYALSATRKMDYWRIYGAEAYAAGISLAFHLRTAISGDPTASESGVLDSLARTVAFYKRNASLFHGLTWDRAEATTSDTAVKTSCAWKASSRSWIVHMVNHHDAGGLEVQTNVEVSIPLDSAPESVALVSPDRDSSLRHAPFSFAPGTLKITVDSLFSSAILVVKAGDASGIRNLSCSGRSPLELVRSGVSWTIRWPGHPGARIDIRSPDGQIETRLSLDEQSRAVWRPSGSRLHLLCSSEGARKIPILAE